MSMKNNLTEFIDVSSHLLKTLSDLQYGADTVKNYRRILNRIGAYMEGRGISTYSENVGTEFLKHQLDKGPISDSYSRALRVAVKRLNDTYFKNRYIRRHEKHRIALPFEWDTVLNDYLLSCKQHGNHENTIKNKRRFCVCFLSALSSLGIQDLAELEAGIIVRACLMLENKGSYAEVRRFLIYLNDTQIVCSNFSHIVPRYIRPIKLPSIYPPSDIHRLESSIDQSTVVGIRNYAVLLLASRLGMRSGDIVNLKFDNLDFPNEKIQFFQQKTWTAFVAVLARQFFSER